ncbi:hypothetical protein ACN47E_005954 [Coniothyrium glycines]
MPPDKSTLTPESSDSAPRPDPQSPAPLPVSAPPDEQPAKSALRPSAGRALVPQQALSPLAHGTASTVSSLQDEPAPSPAGGGPTGKVYTVPPRPKPGRKPATDEPASKRKAQNRESQRAFRARKVQKVNDLAGELETMKREHRRQMIERANDIDQLEQNVRFLMQQNQRLAQDAQYWKDLHHGIPRPINHHVHFADYTALYMHAQQDAQAESPLCMSTPGALLTTPAAHAYGTPNTETFGCGNCKPDSCACLDEITNDMTIENNVLTPMDAVPLPSRKRSTSMRGIEQSTPTSIADDAQLQDMEVDFTTRFTRTTEALEGPGCGFCDNNPDVCLCRDESLRPIAMDGFAALSRVASRDSMQDMKPKPLLKGPGSCSDCQANPRQREWCQGVAARVAQLKAEATPPRSRRGSSKSITLDVMEPKVESSIDHNKACASPVGERSIGCSEAFKLLDGRVPMDIDNMDWRNLKPVPHIPMHRNDRNDSFTMEPGTYSAIELDASSILTTLQHSRRALEPRPSDGAHASLVRIAEERRRATLSPMTGPTSPSALTSISAFAMSR